MKYLQKIKNRDEIQEVVKEAKRAGKIIVQCHGCFDILHPGHLRYLSWAKERGDMLIVSVSADKVVNKGNFRPYVPQELRAENLAALEVVDYVTIDDGEWAGPILELLKPHIYVKGKEFENVFTGRIGKERQLVESYGGKVLFSSGDVVYSSTKIIEEHRDKLGYADEHVLAFCRRHGITKKRLSDVFATIAGKRILVVGDAIVDKYVYCDRLGMSADAPVLVVRPLGGETFLGGAGIVAQHANALGATSVFCTVIGQDADGSYVRSELERRKVASELVADSTRPTTTKTRYLSDGKKLLNVNQYRDHNLDLPVTTELEEKIRRNSDQVDAIIICDFGYGVITNRVLDVLCEIGSKRNIPIVGDVQSSSQMGNVTRMKNITAITPSEREARIALCDRESGIADLGARILAQTHNRSLIITMAERGLMVFEPEGGPLGKEAESLPLHEIKKGLATEYLPSFARAIADPMGAGDALLATLTCCLAAGTSIMEAALIGNCAAAVEVSKLGNVPLNRDELFAVLDSLLPGEA